MNSFQRQFEQLLIAVYQTDFENAYSKIEAFEKEYPAVATDYQLSQKITLLWAEIHAHEGRLQEALDLNKTVLNQYSITDYNYLPLSLTIAKLLISLGSYEIANTFIESILAHSADSTHFDPLILVNFLALYSKNDVGKFESQIAYISDELKVDIDETDMDGSLQEIQDRIKREGQELTKIVALSSTETVETTINKISTFLDTSKLSPYRQEALNFMTSLQE
jgi:tetratricopeptide (TPR) repeat protein